MKPKLLVILGPTATGKSDLAVKLARKYNGEVISADSRQVYKGLNIGTGKITKKEMCGIPHHMLDIVSPKNVYSVSDFQKQAGEVLLGIISRGKLPIICGGTGFYIQSIVDGIVLPEVPPNKILRAKLEGKSLEELQIILKKLDENRYKNIDTKNSVRLIRAIEIAETIGKVPTLRQTQGKNLYKFLQIGLKVSEEELKSRIHKRLLSRMKKGMIKEVKNLHKDGLSFKRMRELGLEYRYLANYLEKGQPLKASGGRMTISKNRLAESIEKGNMDYAKRQMTWFKRDKKIKWFSPTEVKKIQKEVEGFLSK